jgi:saccharopine dehydrogenase (NAD+, L-lysine-forming)
MHPDQTIIILGGSGRAGRAIAEGLLQHTSTRVVLAGRDPARAQTVADGFNQRFGGRAQATRVDITDPASLRAAFAGCHMGIVAVPYAGNAAHHVITAALDAGIDYLDINTDPGKHQVLAREAGRIRQGHRRFLSEAGIIPGCPALLLRQAAAELDHLDCVTVGSLMQDPQMPRGSAADIVAHAGSSAQRYRNGDWRLAGPMVHRWLDFGRPFGTRFCVPISLPELRALSDDLLPSRLGVYQAGFNPVLNLLLLAWKLLRFSHTARGRAWGIDLFLRANRRFSRPPTGIVVLLEARGRRNGRPQTWRLALQHADVYEATAIPVVAGVRQLLDAPIARPQQGFFGHRLGPERLLTDMERMGLRVQRGLTAA